MTVFYERCPCGAEFRVEDESLDDATARLEKWREVHRHEPASDDRNVDLTGTHHGTSWTDTGLGFYPPSAIEDKA